jgi:hypothetical protein
LADACCAISLAGYVRFWRQDTFRWSAFGQKQRETATEQPKFRLFRHRLNLQRPRVSAENGISLADNLRENSENSEKRGFRQISSDQRFRLRPAQIAPEAKPSHIIVERRGRGCYRSPLAFWRTA